MIHLTVITTMCGRLAGVSGVSRQVLGVLSRGTPSIEAAGRRDG
jgi:hypothetical protein